MIFRDRYGPADRLFHRIAFRLGIAQRALADLEGALYGDEISSVPDPDPVFVTSLPRSGTTILLQLLVGSGRFASHTYRDVPFVLCPMVWRHFSRRFAVDDAPRERAHGDGLQVSADSPEAFEEMIWKEFWEDHYLPDRIVPWSGRDRNPEFDEFFETHMRKVIAVRRDGPSRRLRYLSKNNVNVARLAARPGPMGSGTFVVPFRTPVQQAASMLRQHRRFLEIHAEDDFVRLYMEAIGHHDFGKGLRPVDFGGWLEGAPDPVELEFWVRYWHAAYRFVLDHSDEAVVLVSYARLTHEPESALDLLAREIGIPSRELTPLAPRLHPPRTHHVDLAGVPTEILEGARGLYAELEARARV